MSEMEPTIGWNAHCANLMSRISELELQNNQLHEALASAKQTIRVWHGSLAWDIYDKASPEMKLINAALEDAR